MKKTSRIYALIAILTLSGSLFAQPGPRPGKPGIPYLDIEGLSKEQKEKIQSIYLEHAREALVLRNKIAEKDAALQTELSQANPDRKKMDKILEELYGLKLDLEQSRLKARLDVRDQLNDEQKLQFDLRRQRLDVVRLRQGRDGDRRVFRHQLPPRQETQIRRFQRRDTIED